MSSLQRQIERQRERLTEKTEGKIERDRKRQKEIERDRKRQKEIERDRKRQKEIERDRKRQREIERLRCLIDFLVSSQKVIEKGRIFDWPFVMEIFRYRFRSTQCFVALALSGF